VEEVKSKREVREFVKYCRKLVRRLEKITDGDIARLMLGEEIKALKPYIFEFKIQFNLFEKHSKNEKKRQNLTQIFCCFKKL
jgi:hypothetical protein